MEIKVKAQTVPPFTSDFKINVSISDDPNPLEFFYLFLDDAFYDYITIQTNIYTDQYLAAYPNCHFIQDTNNGNH